MPKLSRADYELQKARLQLTFSRDRESKRHIRYPQEELVVG